MVPTDQEKDLREPIWKSKDMRAKCYHWRLVPMFSVACVVNKKVLDDPNMESLESLAK